MFRKCHVWSSKDHAELLNAGFSGLICIPGIFFFFTLLEILNGIILLGKIWCSLP